MSIRSIPDVPVPDPLDDDPSVPLPMASLRAIADGIARAEPLWRAVTHHEEIERRPVRLLATDRYEVWVIGWTTGQGVDLHDHGPSAGVLAVVEGRLVDVTLTGHRLTRTTVAAGQQRSLRVGLVHDVVNPFLQPATSVHVYSPPLSVMHRYDRATHRVLAAEPVATEAPALPAVGGSVLLHPSSSA